MNADDTSTSASPRARPVKTKASELLAAFVFGLTIGIVTALSRADGTSTTLLGLLFTLAGGSIVALYKGRDLSPTARRAVLAIMAWVCIGILVGIVSIFGLFTSVGGRDSEVAQDWVLQGASRSALDDLQRAAASGQQSSSGEVSRSLMNLHNAIESFKEEAKRLSSMTGVPADVSDKLKPFIDERK